MNEEPLAEEFIRGFSKPLILWLLCVRPRYGYDLMKEFKELDWKKVDTCRGLSILAHLRERRILGRHLDGQG
jgi:DNA-binding PadR family transcriptional regulator